MTNTVLLRQRIKASGLKLQHIADYLGISRAALTMKIENVSDFRQKGKLTEVALADLPKLMEAAKEETNAD